MKTINGPVASAPTLKDLVNTPTKQIALAVMILGNVFMLSSPVMISMISVHLRLSAMEITELTAGYLISAEAMAALPIIVLGKPVLALVKAKFLSLFKRKNRDKK
ncbi:hypothetical protein LNL84_11550 [Vibrio sp. ZSDZ34]|uniref:Uncharacterized protein n=1 Tax=Vibrio gelatinilyticus TaxID=2893468 RepID=A0A9X1WCF6_9VIBR|nr:hypothetical protein [Vibrio gelatinilyticus]MCJ2377466.1 hypothetical protein [Vibrio gelatinilyticus]